ncbi:TIGR03885 family FMN-dependent LLM class oxidoreductase [Actinomarinicola tropica]|uniref:TIGR03885 family FMN-dependent LLM class oxidoreductase n=1 Tax=Actinomarinicola tropica TaxID=2789776 RepID=A0A5Q2RK16_9ACTN|nr:TIGR03885 family FMN-dependent LLM class oxidoreductase [Actinomarinicola tropica]QGG96173.1 TIGR03885 family FMN-dependent LLM class oxidoreductase [Actinomarinicola tropica]
MTVIGFHASHEQIHPRQLLADVQRAEQAGFTAAMCSDHFAPWSERQGHSGFAWSWLGAALATTDLPFGVVNAPGQRYHPAIVAQAIATLGAMFPGRFWAALGSGENMNEHITGDAWPRKEVRQARLEESVSVIRRLLDGEEVSHDGLVTVDRATLWTRPEVRPPLVAPAVSVATARRSASWADGLVTINQPLDHLRHMVEAYRGAGGRGRVALQVHVSWAPTEDEAVAIAMDQWRTNVFSPPVCWDLDTPEAFDEVSRDVTEQSVRDAVVVVSDTGQAVERLGELVDVGFDEVYLHHVGQEQARFIDTFGESVLPQLDVSEPERRAG